MKNLHQILCIHQLMQGRLLYSFNNLKDIFNSNADNFPMLCPLFRGIFLLFHFDLHST